MQVQWHGSPGQLGLRVTWFLGHWVAGSQNVTQFHVWRPLHWQVEAGCFLEKIGGSTKNELGDFFSGGTLLVQTPRNVENPLPRDVFWLRLRPGGPPRTPPEKLTALPYNWLYLMGRELTGSQLSPKSLGICCRDALWELYKNVCAPSRTPLKEITSHPQTPLAARALVVLFVEVVSAKAFVRKVGLSTKADKSTYTAFARSLHLPVHMDS